MPKSTSTFDTVTQINRVPPLIIQNLHVKFESDSVTCNSGVARWRKVGAQIFFHFSRRSEKQNKQFFFKKKFKKCKGASRYTAFDGCISSNIMKSPSPNCYMIVWDMAIYSDTPTDQTLHQFVNLLPSLTLLPNFGRFPWNIATGAASQQRTLTPPDTWSCPIWDLHLF